MVINFDRAAQRVPRRTSPAPTSTPTAVCGEQAAQLAAKVLPDLIARLGQKAITSPAFVLAMYDFVIHGVRGGAR